MLEFLPDNIKKGIAHINLQKLYEIRIRAQRPVFVNYDGEYRVLSVFGVTDILARGIICSMEEIADCIFRAGNCSIYSVEEQIKKGFITADGGERIGLAGEYVFERGQPFSIRNFTSICVRMPHEVVGCCEAIYDICMADTIKNTLIMSPPGLGKTTILRDISRRLSEKTWKNILICDERGEIAIGDFGRTCDVLKFSDKATAFEAGIRAMRPDIIITDELSEVDCDSVRKAINSGVKIIASAHFSDIRRIKAPFFPLFDRYVLLDEKKIGKLMSIYNENGEELTL